MKALAERGVQLFSDYQGRQIRLTDRQLAHIRQEHPEIMESAIGETLADPDKVLQSSRDEQSRLYYRWYYATAYGDKYACVVVIVHEDDAFIATAYLAGRTGRGAVIWEREK